MRQLDSWAARYQTVRLRTSSFAITALVAAGFTRARNSTILFLNSGTVAAIERGDAIVTGRDEQGAVVAEFTSAKALMPKTVWVRESHNAQTSGTLIVSKLLPGRSFPFPKSLYAVEDAIRFFVKDKPNAIVLDYFAGSGTTAHAVARLNRQDGGLRQSICVTNNEVSADEARVLHEKGFRPGDSAVGGSRHLRAHHLAANHGCNHGTYTGGKNGGR